MDEEGKNKTQIQTEQLLPVSGVTPASEEGDSQVLELSTPLPEVPQETTTLATEEETTTEPSTLPSEEETTIELSTTTPEPTEPATEGTTTPIVLLAGLNAIEDNVEKLVVPTTEQPVDETTDGEGEILPTDASTNVEGSGTDGKQFLGYFKLKIEFRHRLYHQCR